MTKPNYVRRPKKPFMIYRDNGDGNDFLRCTYGRPKYDTDLPPQITSVKWVDWEGSKFSTKEEAERIIERLTSLRGATVIEIIEEHRYRSST